MAQDLLVQRSEAVIRAASSEALLRSKVEAIRAFALIGNKALMVQAREEAHGALDAWLDAQTESETVLALHMRKLGRGA
jgi:hypothetical protein